jgi:hypothetical protein
LAPREAAAPKTEAPVTKGEDVKTNLLLLPRVIPSGSGRAPVGEDAAPGVKGEGDVKTDAPSTIIYSCRAPKGGDLLAWRQ